MVEFKNFLFSLKLSLFLGVAMFVARSLYEYISIVDRYEKVVVVGENCRDCSDFLARYGRCLDGFVVVMIPVDMDDELLEFFYLNDMLGLPIVVIGGFHYCGDLDYLGSVICRYGVSSPV